jgi:hypothetical protein
MPWADAEKPDLQSQNPFIPSHFKPIFWGAPNIAVMLLGALIALNQGTAIAPYQLEDKLGSQHTVHSLYTYGRNPPLLIVRQKGY